MLKSTTSNSYMDASVAVVVFHTRHSLHSAHVLVGVEKRLCRIKYQRAAVVIVVEYGT